jgi:hypothetical protein
MSTRFDILDAKQAVIDHVGKHLCRLGDGCPERLRLTRAYNGSDQSAAGKWHLEYGDDEKQREQSHARQKA